MPRAKKTIEVRFDIDKGQQEYLQTVYLENLTKALEREVLDMNTILRSVRVVDHIPVEGVWKKQIVREIRRYLGSSKLIGEDVFCVGTHLYKMGTAGSHVWFSRKHTHNKGNDDANDWTRLFAVTFNGFY